MIPIKPTAFLIFTVLFRVICLSWRKWSLLSVLLMRIIGQRTHWLSRVTPAFEAASIFGSHWLGEFGWPTQIGRKHSSSSKPATQYDLLSLAIPCLRFQGGDHRDPDRRNLHPSGRGLHRAEPDEVIERQARMSAAGQNEKMGRCRLVCLRKGTSHLRTYQCAPQGAPWCAELQDSESERRGAVRVRRSAL
jgi:hypothetical protein